MKKISLFLSLLVMAVCLNANDLFNVYLMDGATITGYILEDKPSSYVMVETESGGLEIIKYDRIWAIRPVDAGEKKEIEEKEEVVIEEESEVIEGESSIASIPEEEIIIVEDVEEVIIPVYSEIDLMDSLNDLSLVSLTYLELDNKIQDTELFVRERVFEANKKDDTLKYTIWNILPGVGSFLQGDYYSAVYTVSSILATALYNLNDGFGTDLHFVVNLNAVFAYGVSFFAPARYNNKYNKTLESKLLI